MSNPSKDAAAPDQGRMLRDVLGLFPTGVAVITAVSPEGERLGATVSSFNSVSLTPPLILFSMAKTAKSFPAWEAVEQFAVNILNENQSRISTQFARSLSDKWEGLDPVAGRVTGIPLIRDALAWLECRTWARYEGGDHLIIVGEVLGFERLTSGAARPLVFSASRYARLATDAEIATPPHEGHLVHGW
ncbi:MAG: actVB [Hyphomicrobiales bacterium]|nr:actVB [Hyphomicrobiales bacterium]